MSWGWRLSLGLAAIPATALTLGGLLLPDSPASLEERGRPAEARRVLERVRGTADVDAGGCTTQPWYLGSSHQGSACGWDVWDCKAVLVLTEGVASGADEVGSSIAKGLCATLSPPLRLLL